MVSLAVKEVLCLFYSVLLFLSGIILVGFSAISSYKIFYNFKFFPSAIVIPFVLFVLLGILHCLLTWLAFKGPTVKYDFHIILFIVMSICLFIIEFGIGIWNVILWNDVGLESMTLAESFFSAIEGDFNKNSGWTRLQNKLKCCGLNGAKDFLQGKGTYPTSCCDEQIAFNLTCYDVGCRQPLARHASGIMLDGILMSFLSCFLQAIGVFIFCSFLRSLKMERNAKSARRLALQKELAEHSEHSTPLTQSPYAINMPVHYPQNCTPKSSKTRRSKSAAPLTPPIHENV